MRFVVYGVFAAAGSVVQTAWLTYLPLWGGVADPLLPVIMTVGLLHGSEEGALVGAGVGLLHDIMSGAPLGLGMATGVCVGFAAGLGERSVSLDAMWLPAAGGAVLTLLAAAVTVTGTRLIGLGHAPLAAMLGATVGSACYNGIIAVPIFHGLRRLDSAAAALYGRSV
jgi:rod shape-determining protein MreD